MLQHVNKILSCHTIALLNLGYLNDVMV